MTGATAAAVGGGGAGGGSLLRSARLNSSRTVCRVREGWRMAHMLSHCMRHPASEKGSFHARPPLFLQRAPLVDQHAHGSPGLPHSVQRRVGRASTAAAISGLAQRAAGRGTWRWEVAWVEARRRTRHRRPGAGRRAAWRRKALLPERRLRAGGWPLGFTCRRGPSLAFPGPLVPEVRLFCSLIASAEPACCCIPPFLQARTVVTALPAGGQRRG